MTQTTTTKPKRADRQGPERRMNRYRVTSVWGKVPEQVREMVMKPDAYLLYPEYRGLGSHESIMDLDSGEIVGGWSMAYAGKKP